jgi:BCD family chlorophyll transporter-like MFS transporter
MAMLGWLGIVRLGLVQSALGAIVVLTTSTLNRVMVVELALPALVPGVLVALHHALQMLRPRFGYGSDVGGRRTPWIIGGMAALASGGFLAALATAWAATSPAAGLALATVAFAMIGIGVGAAGTSLLVLLAKQVVPGRRGPAATIVWVMMIAGFVATAGLAGHFLDPFTLARLVLVSGVVCAAAFVVALLAVWGVERAGAPAPGGDGVGRVPFRDALLQVWSEPQARRFTIFVFVSMLAYSAQDLILEPFAGIVFGLTPGQSTRLSAIQNSGVLLGMIVVGVAAGWRRDRRAGSLRAWTIGGCAASGLALLGLAAAGYVGPAWPLRISVFVLGAANGAFSVAAIGSMMALVGAGRASREGVRMGLWGAAQAIAFAAGGLVGTAAVDLMRVALDSPLAAYSSAFALEALAFLWAAWLAARVGAVESREHFGPLVSPPRLAAETSTR